MSADEKPSLGDLLAPGSDYLKRQNRPCEPLPLEAVNFRLRELSTWAGADPDELIHELGTNSALATVARKLLGIERPERRGRKPNIGENWLSFVNVEMLTRSLGSKNAAFDQLAAERTELGANAQQRYRGRIVKAHERAMKRWSVDDVPDWPVAIGWLATLFYPPPTRRKLSTK